MKSVFAVVVMLACFSPAATLDMSQSHLRASVTHSSLKAEDAHVSDTWNFVQEQAADGQWTMALDSFESKPKKGKKRAGGAANRTLMFVLLALCCCCCIIPLLIFCVSTFFFATVGVMAIGQMQNEEAKTMRTKFDTECPEEQQKKYCSKSFKDKCDTAFGEADKNGDGVLVLSELKEALKPYKGDVPDMVMDTYMKAFDDNGDSKIDKAEFFEMMKYMEFSKDQKAAKTEEGNATEAAKA